MTKIEKRGTAGERRERKKTGRRRRRCPYSFLSPLHSFLALLLLICGGSAILSLKARAGTTVPTATVTVNEAAGAYVAEFFNLAEPAGKALHFAFSPSDPACKDQARIAQGTSLRYIYAGQVDEHYAKGGVGMVRREKIGTDCPRHVEHTVQVRVWDPSGGLDAQASAPFCLGGCETPTAEPTATPSQTPVPATDTPAPTSTETVPPPTSTATAAAAAAPPTITPTATPTAAAELATPPAATETPELATPPVATETPGATAPAAAELAQQPRPSLQRCRPQRRRQALRNGDARRQALPQQPRPSLQRCRPQRRRQALPQQPRQSFQRCRSQRRRQALRHPRPSLQRCRPQPRRQALPQQPRQSLQRAGRNRDARRYRAGRQARNDANSGGPHRSCSDAGAGGRTRLQSARGARLCAPAAAVTGRRRLEHDQGRCHAAAGRAGLYADAADRRRVRAATTTGRRTRVGANPPLPARGTRADKTSQPTVTRRPAELTDSSGDPSGAVCSDGNCNVWRSGCSRRLGLVHRPRPPTTRRITRRHRRHAP